MSHRKNWDTQVSKAILGACKIVMHVCRMH